MLNRKTQSANGAQHHANGGQRGSATKGRKHRRFILSTKARGGRRANEALNGSVKVQSSPTGKPGSARGRALTPAGPSIPPDVTETIKTLVQLAREHGHITYDDINDALPEGLSPEDLDALYVKLRGLDI